MSKKKKASSAAKEKRDLTKFCAFWSLAISAVLYIVSGVIHFIMWLMGKLNVSLDGGVMGTLTSVCGVFQFLGNIALILAVALPAYGYVRGRSRGWKIFFWVALAIFALGVVFSFLPVF